MNLLKDMSKFNKLTTYNCLHISTKHNSVKTSSNLISQQSDLIRIPLLPAEACNCKPNNNH